MPFSTYTETLAAMGEVHAKYENLMKAGETFKAAFVLMEDGQTGLAYRIVTMEKPDRFSLEQKCALVRAFAERIDVAHAKRVSSFWRISRELPEDIRELFKGGAR